MAVVTQHVEHVDPPVTMNDDEAAVVASQCWAGAVERGIGAAPINDCADALADDGPWFGDDEINLLDFNRNPKEMLDALGTGLPLNACRVAMTNDGRAWRLITGTMVFVHPWQYLSVMRALEGCELKRSQVVVARSLEHLLEESIADIGRGV
jgi:hypothetical protein